MPTVPYTSSLTDAEWDILQPLLTPARPCGAPLTWPRRQLLDALLYVLRGGIAWRELPRHFPPWQTVYYHFRQMRLQGVWERINAVLSQQYRVGLGRTPQAHAAIIDSQSAKTTEVGGERGYDGNKKVKGRKRHILVDTLGLLLKIKVHSAHLQDRQGGRLLVEAAKGQFPALDKIWADQGYTGSFKRWVAEELNVEFEVVYPWWRQVQRYNPELLEAQGFDPKAFHVLPRRWVVERTFAWLGRSRRLTRDFERRADTTETWCYIAMSRLVLRRLTSASTDIAQRAA